MGLILVQADGEWTPVKRLGRFSVEAECAHSPHHLAGAVAEAWTLMVSGLRSKGFELLDSGFELRGPEAHLEFSEAVDADPGPMAERPDPRDRAAWERYERAEKARTARQAGEDVSLVDFILVGKFRRRVPRHFRTAAPGRPLPALAAIR